MQLDKGEKKGISNLWFRKPEVTPRQTDEICTGPEEGCLAAPAPAGHWIDETGLQGVDNDAADVIHVAC